MAFVAFMAKKLDEIIFSILVPAVIFCLYLYLFYTYNFKFTVCHLFKNKNIWHHYTICDPSLSTKNFGGFVSTARMQFIL